LLSSVAGLKDPLPHKGGYIIPLAFEKISPKLIWLFSLLQFGDYVMIILINVSLPCPAKHHLILGNFLSFFVSDIYID